MQRIAWTDKVTNADVLIRCGVEKPMLLDIIMEAKTRYLEEKRIGAFYKLVLYGKITGKATRGRRRSTLMEELR